MYIDHVDESTGVGQRFCLNADHADTADTASKLDCGTIGNITTPVFFQNGVPQTCEQIKTETLTIDVNGTTAGSFNGSEEVTINIETISEEDVNNLLENYLPLSAGESKKLTGALGLTENVMYGTTLPATGFDGQLFFLAEDAEGTPLYVPENGHTGEVLIKNSAVSGDYSWKELVALPKGGNPGQVLVKNSDTDGDASWAQADYLPLTGGTITGGLILNSQNYVDPFGQNFALGIYGSDSAVSGIAVINSTQGITLYLTPDGYMGLSDSTGDTIVYKNPKGHYHLGPSGVYSDGSVLFGAAWNDYAEYRSQKEVIEPGYCVASADNGQVYKTTEKFQACDGIVSDTFGFAIGETDECKTPLAVAGRVLAYCEGNRQDYHSGDTVCASPNGKVCKMTREEIREWPDRIIGIVSEIPEYETWGDKNILVNGRIWIKVK